VILATPRRPGSILLEPPVLAALVVLVVNDHVLKSLWGGWLTGKLSDLAILIVAPVLVAAFCEVARPGLVARRPSLVAAVVASFAVGYAAMLLVPLVGDAYRVGLGLAQWPFGALAALATGSPVTGPTRVAFAADPTDLLTLPALVVPLLLASRRAGA
jgi:hypothetical protein